MNQRKTLTALVLIIAILSTIASAFGIFSSGGSGSYEYETIRGEIIEIFGKGIYRHMSSEVAIQGIAQDIVTLFIGVPLLSISIYYVLKGSLRARYILTGIIGYFLLTYLFYLTMVMYNEFFLLYVILTGTSFFAFIILLISLIKEGHINLTKRRPALLSGIFLIINASMMALLWLGRVLPPLLEGSIYPAELHHYTTLIVQGMDLSLLLPFGFVVGILLLRQRPHAKIYGLVYLIFLSLLMTSLSAKIVYMGLEGYPIIPVIFIMPTILIISVLLSMYFLRNIKA